MQSGVVDPTRILTQGAALDDVVSAHPAFDKRPPGWL